MEEIFNHCTIGSTIAELLGAASVFRCFKQNDRMCNIVVTEIEAIL